MSPQIPNPPQLDPSKKALASEIYSQLGRKTQTGNVYIHPVYQHSGIAYAKSIGGVFTLRVNNSQTHFGNPFSSIPQEIQKGCLPTSSTKESVEKYIQWILQDPPSPIEPKRHAWIRETLKTGILQNKPLVYYKELHQPSHATALDYLINTHFKTLKKSLAVLNKQGEIILNETAIREDFEAGFPYLQGKSPLPGSQQKREVFARVDLIKFKNALGSAERYMEFIQLHEEGHQVQKASGELTQYPKDWMSPEAILLERKANGYALKKLGIRVEDIRP